MFLGGVRLSEHSGSAALEDAFLVNRDALLRFLRARGAGDAAEDILHELWLRLAAAPVADVTAPLPYMMRAANRLMIDRFRSDRQAGARDDAWAALAAEPGGASPAPSVERVIAARQALRSVESALANQGERVERVFRRHRVDGLSQRDVAAELGVSLSTVEADLRRAYRALAELREAGE